MYQSNLTIEHCAACWGRIAGPIHTTGYTTRAARVTVINLCAACFRLGDEGGSPTDEEIAALFASRADPTAVVEPGMVQNRLETWLESVDRREVLSYFWADPAMFQDFVRDVCSKLDASVVERLLLVVRSDLEIHKGRDAKKG